MSQPTATDAISSYSSGLDQAPARFLSRVIQHTLTNAWQTPDDFLQHFGPNAIMQSLSSADVLRSKLLVQLANVHEKIARKKSIESAAEDLKLALEEGITSPEALLEQYPADDRVRYLSGSLLWNFVFEDAFHKTTRQDGEAAHGRAVRRMTFLLECALNENLVTLEQISDGIGFAKIADCLPPDELRRVVIRALEGSRRGEPLNEARFLDVVSLAKLTGFVPLEVVWNEVIVARIAKPHGWVVAPPAPAAVTESKAPQAAPQSTETEAKPQALAPQAEAAVEPASKAEEKPSAEKEKGADEKEPSSGPRSSQPPVVAEEAKDSEVVAASEVKAEPTGATADEARGRAVQRLKDIDRLPPHHDDLSTPILLSIESMYEDLLQATSDDERSECIRESFPNETQLRTAMFALAELLEPGIDVTKPPICDVDTDALVKLVVFEERKRKDGDSSMRRSSVRPPPLPVGRSASSIPAARVSGPNKGHRD